VEEKRAPERWGRPPATRALAAPGVAWGGGGIGVRRICLAHKPDDEAILGVTGLVDVDGTE